MRCPTKKIDLSNLCRDGDCPVSGAASPVSTQSANTTQCAVDAIKVAFQWAQTHAFAKSSPDTRTYLVCIHPTVPIRKQPKIWRS
jgi:hypothetical protein